MKLKLVILFFLSSFSAVYPQAISSHYLGIGGIFEYRRMYDYAAPLPYFSGTGVSGGAEYECTSRSASYYFLYQYCSSTAYASNSDVPVRENIVRANGGLARKIVILDKRHLETFFGVASENAFTFLDYRENSPFMQTVSYSLINARLLVKYFLGDKNNMSYSLEVPVFGWFSISSFNAFNSWSQWKTSLPAVDFYGVRNNVTYEHFLWAHLCVRMKYNLDFLSYYSKYEYTPIKIFDTGAGVDVGFVF